MINAHLKLSGSGFIATFITDEGKPIATENLTSNAEARRRMYFHNRNYIVVTLVRWLKQRKFALSLHQKENSAIASYLIARLVDYQFTPFRVVEGFIRTNEELFVKCSPGEKSKHDKYYQNVIAPILNFCKAPERK